MRNGQQVIHSIFKAGKQFQRLQSLAGMRGEPVSRVNGNPVFGETPSAAAQQKIGVVPKIVLPVGDKGLEPLAYSV